MKLGQKGFNIVHAMLAVLVVGLIVGTGWYVWQSKSKTDKTLSDTTQGAGDAVKKDSLINTFAECANAGNPVQESFPEVCTTKDGKRFVNDAKSAQQYVIVKEWGIRIPLTDETTDLAYHYTKNDVYESVSFTFTRLQDAGICKTDVGVSLTRNKTENKPPYDISNPQSIAKAGDYYYYPAYGGSPCYDDTNVEQMKVVKTINNGDLKNGVLDLLKNLKPVPSP